MKEAISKDPSIPEILNKRVRITSLESSGVWVSYHECSYFIPQGKYTEAVPSVIQPSSKIKVNNDGDTF